ncbi:MAG: extracellular solute-binding protein [Elusimicrobia bacterium]|nr:extracellular solute-binding protein [Elusimicrobiota bacterium]MBU2614666.1 extracellular solute-binding protein [Elusimicrobiota bacterium]
MRKKFALLALFLFCTASQSFPKDNKVTLHLWQLPNRWGRNITEKVNYVLIERFKQLHPDILLTGTKLLVIPGSDSFDAGQLLAMAGGNAPDVMYINFRKSESFITQGFLYPLDNYIKEWEKKDNIKIENVIHPAILPVVKRYGHYWCIPYETEVMVLMYRKDHFKEAGIEGPPKDWDELYEDAKKLYIPEKRRTGLGLSGGSIAAWQFMTFLWSAGGEAVIQDEKGDWHAVFNSPEAVTALKYYQKLIAGKWTRGGKEYRGVCNFGSTMYADWIDERVSMIFNYLTETVISTVDPELIGIAPVPKGPIGKGISEINASMLGINATIKDKATRDAAWEYVKYMASDEAKKIKVKVLVENGYAKMLNPKYLRKFGFERYLWQIPPGWEEALDESLANGKPEPYGKNCDLIYSYMGPAVESSVMSEKADIKGLLDEAVKITEEKMLGYLSKEETHKRSVVTWIIVVIAGVLLTFFLSRIIGNFTKVAGNKGEAAVHKKTLAYYSLPILMLAPAVSLILIWAYYPLLRGILMGFQDYNLVLPSKFIGLENFRNVIFTRLFWESTLHTFEYSFWYIGLGFIIPIIFAIMVDEIKIGKVFFRTVFYLPAVITGLMVMVLWKQLYDPTEAGLLNRVLLSCQIVKEPMRWLDDPNIAMICVVFPSVWARVGAASLIFQAALKTIPTDMYEAAELDGCGVIHKLRYITIPFLAPLIIISFVGTFIGSMHAFAQVMAMTGGGPANVTKVLGLNIWENAYMYLKFGYATSMAWIMGSLLIGFTYFQLRVLKNAEFRRGGD